MIPIEVFLIASIGMDVWLGAIAYGASQVVVVSAGNEPEGYIEAIRAQMSIAQTILSSLGYTGRHLELIVTESAPALEAALWALAPAKAPERTGTFNLSAEKRTTLDFAIDHLAKNAPAPKAVWVGKVPGVPSAIAAPAPREARSGACCALRPSPRNNVRGPSYFSAPFFTASAGSTCFIATSSS